MWVFQHNVWMDGWLRPHKNVKRSQWNPTTCIQFVCVCWFCIFHHINAVIITFSSFLLRSMYPNMQLIYSLFVLFRFVSFRFGFSSNFTMNLAYFMFISIKTMFVCKTLLLSLGERSLNGFCEEPRINELNCMSLMSQNKNTILYIQNAYIHKHMCVCILLSYLDLVCLQIWSLYAIGGVFNYASECIERYLAHHCHCCELSE